MTNEKPVNQSEVPGAEAAEGRLKELLGDIGYKEITSAIKYDWVLEKLWNVSIEALAGASWAVGEKWISVDEYEEVVQGKLSDKPVIKMLNQANIKFKDWKTNIHDLVDKEMGAIREVRVKLPTPPATKK